MALMQDTKPSRKKAALISGPGSREILLEATSNILRTRDTLDVSLSEIAQASGISAALVKYYFGSKDGLLLALVERDSALALLSFMNLLDLPIPATKKLRYHVEGIIRTYWRYPYLPRLVNLVITRSAPTEAGEISERFIRPIVNAHAALIQQGVEAGEFDEIDPMAFYFLVIGVSQEMFTSGGVAKHVFGIDEISSDMVTDYTNQVWKILWGGIRRERPAG